MTKTRLRATCSFFYESGEEGGEGTPPGILAPTPSHGFTQEE